MEDRSVLNKGLGRTDVIALGFGTIVGWGWIMMGASWVTGAGCLGAVIAFLLGGGVLLLIGLVYGELTAALPLAGGEFVFVYRAIGQRTAFLTGWGGLSVSFQTAAVLSESNLSLRYHLIGRMLSGTFSAILAFLAGQLLFPSA